MRWLKTAVLWQFLYKLLGKALDLYTDMRPDFREQAVRFEQQDKEDDGVEEVKAEVVR